MIPSHKQQKHLQKMYSQCSVHHQLCVRKHMLDLDPSDMSPMDFGLLPEQTIQTPSPVTVPHGIPGVSLVTEDILHFIKC